MTAHPDIIASSDTWIESAAVDQLRAVANLPGMHRAVGMPDLHPGNGTPIGAAFAARGVVYPHLVGSDVGCGMAMWTTDQPTHRLKLDRLEKSVDIDDAFTGDVSMVLSEEGIGPDPAMSSLGTIGGGNHFAELQQVSEIIDSERVRELGIDPKCVALLVHSGSRGFGASILRAHTDRRGASPLDALSDAAREYLGRHDLAVRWARANRSVIAARMLGFIDCSATRVLDVCHNNVTPCPLEGADTWLHRKGAAPSDQGAVVIPGSRGDCSYLVDPLGDGRRNLYSLAHGAGRKWERSAAKGKLGNKATNPTLLRRTKIGSRVICDDKALLFEEAPEAYKPIRQIIAPLEQAGLLRVLAILTPLLTYKTRAR